MAHLLHPDRRQLLFQSRWRLLHDSLRFGRFGHQVLSRVRLDCGKCHVTITAVVGHGGRLALISFHDRVWPAKKVLLHWLVLVLLSGWLLSRVEGQVIVLGGCCAFPESEHGGEVRWGSHGLHF